MRAWKFLAPGAVGPFSGVPWPAPAGPDGGAWLQATSLPARAIYACALEDLPYWIADELWEVELGGMVSRARRQLVASRGRLVARIDEWPDAQREFTSACIERTRRRAIDALLAQGNRAAADGLAAAPDLETLRDAAAGLAPGAEIAGYVSDTVRRKPYPGVCAYIAATAAAAIEGKRGFDEERSIQVRWLEERLGLHPSTSRGPPHSLSP